MRYTFELVPCGDSPSCPECGRRNTTTLIIGHRQCPHTQCCNEDCEVEAFGLVWTYCKDCDLGGFIDGHVEVGKERKERQ